MELVPELIQAGVGCFKIEGEDSQAVAARQGSAWPKAIQKQ